MKRLFFALWPDSETRRLIDSFNQRIKMGRLKKVRPDNLHVTLVFLGQVDAKTEVIIRQQVDNMKISPFTIRFDKVDFWCKPRILCLTASKCDFQLLQLVKGITDRVKPLAIHIENRPFRPHVTLARKAVAAVAIAPLTIEWRTRSFSLVESCSTPAGVSYQVLQSWDFL